MTQDTTSFMLVRHAEKIHGLEDLGLTDTGVLQAKETGMALLEWHPTRIFTSTFPRAVQTAKIIGAIHSLEPIARECLVERRVEPPPSEGTPGFKAEWAKVDQSRDYRAYGGESSRIAGERLRSCLREIARECPHERVVVVTHGGITRDFILGLVEQEPKYWNLLRTPFLGSSIPYAGVSGVQFYAGTFSLNFVAVSGAGLISELASPDGARRG